MKYRSKDTVASLLAIPQAKVNSLGERPTQQVAARANCIRQPYKASLQKKPSPDVEAVRFYALNQCMAVIAKNCGQHGRIPDEVIETAEAYSKELVLQSTRMFVYIMLICTREARHVASQGGVFYKELSKKFGPASGPFIKFLAGDSSEGAVQKFLDKPPEMALGQYVDSLSHCFYKGKFSSGYGGIPWGKIADTLCAVVNGKTSLEIMVDTAYTLAHNNGPIFNKGMIYQNYSEYLYKILDVQRSGQVVEMVLTDLKGTDAYSEVQAHCERVAKYYPDDFGKYVDWYKVEALGALKTYHYEKQAQVAQHGAPAKPEMKGMVEYGKIEIFPDVMVTKMKRMK